MPTDFSNAKVYSIRASNCPYVYYGSTIHSLKTRLSWHKKDYKRFKAGKTKDYCSSFIILEHPKYFIELVHAYPNCESRIELSKYEGLAMLADPNACNYFLAGRTTKEYNQTHKDQQQAYRHAYYENNKAYYKAYYKAYNASPEAKEKNRVRYLIKKQAQQNAN